MRLRIGYELQYHFPQPTPVIMMLNIHYTRISDLERPDHIVISPSVPISGYRDGFGNWCSRILAPAGAMRISTDTVVNDTGLPDHLTAGRCAGSGRGSSRRSSRLPHCQPLLRQRSTARSGVDAVRPDQSWLGARPGHLRFRASAHRVRLRARAREPTASEAYEEKRGVCRDYAHLAIAFCRALNIPARYCTGYLGDVGTPLPTRPAISRHGLKPISAASGICSTRETMCRASAGSCWREAATRQMSPSPPRSARIH